MADQSRQASIFMPVTPESQNGPFSGFLTPPSPPQTTQGQMPPATTFGGIAKAATAFLEGASKGRIRAYEMSENEKAAKINALNSFMSQVENDPDLSSEAKAKARNMYWQSMGGRIQEAAGKAGKGGKGGKGGEGDQSTGAHHFLGMVKDFASGLTGGKTPKGMQDVGDTLTQMQNMLYEQGGGPKSEYNLKNIRALHTQNMQKIASGFGSAQPEAILQDPGFSKGYQDWQRVDPEGARNYMGYFAAAYPSKDIQTRIMEKYLDPVLGGSPGGAAGHPPAAAGPALVPGQSTTMNVGGPGHGVSVPMPRMQLNTAAPPPGSTGNPDGDYLVQSYMDKLFGVSKATRTYNLYDPKDPTMKNSVAAAWDSAQNGWVVPGTRQLLPQGQQEWLVSPTVVHPQQDRHQLTTDANGRVIDYNFSTGAQRDTGIKGTPRGNYQKEMLDLRKDAQFQNAENNIYRDFTMGVQRIQMQSNSEIARVPNNVLFLNDQQKRDEIQRISDQRDRDIKALEDMRNSRLGVLYNQHGLKFSTGEPPPGAAVDIARPINIKTWGKIIE